MKENAAPLWAIHALADNEEQIARTLGANLLPIGLTDEIGCGGMGCVWHTLKKGVVFKLSTAEEEFLFAQAVMGMDRPLPGFARFYGAVELGQPAELSTGSRMQAFGIWREWADATARDSLREGDLAKFDALSTAYNAAVLDFSNHNWAWPSPGRLRDAALELSRGQVEQDARSGFVHPTYTGPQLLVALGWIEDLIREIQPLRHVGAALAHMRKQRMLLHDVNEDNVGMFRRGGRKVYAIYDAHLIDER